MKYFSKIAYASLLPALMVLASPARASSINVTDTFSPISLAWSNSTGNWTASSGDYYAQNPNNSPMAQSLLPYDMTNYTLTVTVNALGDSGIVLRSNAADTLYLILGGEGYGQGGRTGYAGNSLYFADSTNLSTNHQEQNFVFTPGDTYTIEVTAVGTLFSVYINGSSTAADTYNDTGAGSDGLVGLSDDQPNTTPGNGGSGTPTTYSNFNLVGTTTTTTPEPGAGLLFGSGLAALAFGFRLARRRFNAAHATRCHPSSDQVE